MDTNRTVISIAEFNVRPTCVPVTSPLPLPLVSGNKLVEYVSTTSFAVYYVRTSHRSRNAAICSHKAIVRRASLLFAFISNCACGCYEATTNGGVCRSSSTRSREFANQLFADFVRKMIIARIVAREFPQCVCTPPGGKKNIFKSRDIFRQRRASLSLL